MRAVSKCRRVINLTNELTLTTRMRLDVHIFVADNSTARNQPTFHAQNAHACPAIPKTDGHASSSLIAHCVVHESAAADRQQQQNIHTYTHAFAKYASPSDRNVGVHIQLSGGGDIPNRDYFDALLHCAHAATVTRQQIERHPLASFNNTIVFCYVCLLACAASAAELPRPADRRLRFAAAHRGPPDALARHEAGAGAEAALGAGQTTGRPLSVCGVCGQCGAAAATASVDGRPAAAATAVADAASAAAGQSGGQHCAPIVGGVELVMSTCGRAQMSDHDVLLVR